MQSCVWWIFVHTRTHFWKYCLYFMNILLIRIRGIFIYVLIKKNKVSYVRKNISRILVFFRYIGSWFVVPHWLNNCWIFVKSNSTCVHKWKISYYFSRNANTLGNFYRSSCVRKTDFPSRALTDKILSGEKMIRWALGPTMRLYPVCYRPNNVPSFVLLWAQRCAFICPASGLTTSGSLLSCGPHNISWLITDYCPVAELLALTHAFDYQTLK